MPEFNFVLLYVENPAVSAEFYAELLGHAPIEQSPTFAMFPLRGDVMLGLWSRATVEPSAAQLAGASEICFMVLDPPSVRRMHEDWRKRGIRILQPPTAMDFGTTFTAADPDGHRLRVYTRAAE